MGWHESLLDTLDRPSIFIHTFKKRILANLYLNLIQINYLKRCTSFKTYLEIRPIFLIFEKLALNSQAYSEICENEST